MLPSAAAIIAAAGFGTRMQLDRPKQYHLLGGEPILVHTVRAFVSHETIDEIVVVAPAAHLEETREILAELAHQAKSLRIVAGGRRRQDSVAAGLRALGKRIEIVLVHDGARPLVNRAVIDSCLAGVTEHGAAIAAIPVKDTLKKGDAGNRITATVDRTGMWQAQTPQGARRLLLERAFAEYGESDVTDEASLLEKAGIPVALAAGAETNIKITRPEDLIVAENLMNRSPAWTLRIGHGYDAHRFARDRKLIIGGVEIEHSHGLAGHSDADVLTHALCDALLGALGEGDIGHHFPDSDQTFAGVYSITLLDRVVDLARQRGFSLLNCDITVVCQRPRLAGYLGEMRKILAKSCHALPQQINIKATTTEKMGFTGREEGISCHAVALLQGEWQNNQRKCNDHRHQP